jgi:hypothetical protein
VEARKRRLDDVENDVNRMGVSGWGKIARDRVILKLILEEGASYMDLTARGGEEEEESQTLLNCANKIL